MTTRRLGNSELLITPIGFGAWAIVGARRPGQIRGVAGAADFRLDDEQAAEMESRL